MYVSQCLCVQSMFVLLITEEDAVTWSYWGLKVCIFFFLISLLPHYLWEAVEESILHLQCKLQIKSSAEGMNNASWFHNMQKRHNLLNRHTPSEGLVSILQTCLFFCRTSPCFFTGLKSHFIWKVWLCIWFRIFQ